MAWIKIKLIYLTYFPLLRLYKTVFKLQTHCTGVLAHTRCPKGKKAYALYDICQWPQDTNLTIHALIHVLLDFGENIPEVLYLQLDNAGNQNKNRYLCLSAGEEDLSKSN